MHTTHVQAPTPAGRTPIFSRAHSLLRRVTTLLALLLCVCGEVNAQSLYVIQNGNNYLSHDASTGVVNTTRTTTFNPTSCFWTISGSYIRPVNTSGEVLGGLYLRPRSNNNSYSLTTNTNSTYAAWTSGLSDGGQPYYRRSDYYDPYYLRLSNTTWQVSTTNSNNGTLYSVSTTNYAAGSLLSFSINGTSSINATGTYSNYTHTNASYFSQACTDYYFNSTHHYLNSSNSTVTLTEVTTGYTWSLSDNATGYATVHPSTGAITVTAIPDQKTNITLYCSLTYSQQTITSSFSISLTKTGIDTSTNTVTLDDREDHSWSYYSDVSLPSQLRSLNPADVKITYYGNGTGTVQTNNNDAPSTWGEDATGVKVGIDADVNTFVYHKTLERTNGSTAASVAAANGRCAYTTIPNPFSVRPTYDSDNTSKYRGFYKWRLKSFSGGSIYTASSGGTALQIGATIDAETEIFFAPTSEYDMEVEFEALWARAYTSTSSVQNKNLGVERNFYIITSNSNSNITVGNYPCTYTSIYPDGTKDGTNVASMSDRKYRYGTFSASADSKIEYIILNDNSSTITCNNHNLTIGRGVTTNGTYCAQLIQGMPDIGRSNVTANLTYTMRVESGSYHYISFINGYTDESGTNHQSTYQENYTYTGSAHSIKVILGCDFDRAFGETGNSSLTLSGPAMMGYRSRLTGTANRTRKTLDLTVKSGSFTTGVGEDMGAADVEESFYLSVAGNHTYVGERALTIEGGVLANIAGGIDGFNNATNTTPSAWSDQGTRSLTVRMKGGVIKGALYGGAAVSPSSGDRYMIITGGTVKGWLGAGCNGVVAANTTTGGQTYGASYVYFGGNAHCGGYSRPINGGHSGDVFAAGKGSGAAGDETSGQMSYGTNIAIADNCTIEHNVYGGGNYGYAMVSTNMYILGGTVEGGIYGGANQNEGPEVNITMTGGLVKKGLYGGSNSSGTVTGPVTMQINGGQVGTSSSPANIHGGGYGSSTVVSGSIDLTIGESNAASGAIIYGDVYGGSALGKVNGTSANTDYHTNVTLNKGTIYGSLYGGALGDASTEANVYGPVQVKVYGGSVNKTSADGSGGVYGANNVKGAPQRSVTVDIYGTDKPESGYALYAVYGGGNKADYTYGNTYPKVTIHNCDNSIEYVYGGGNAAAVASTDVTIYGGDAIGNVFGGGNGTVQAANVTNDANLKIYGGTIHNVFGGSNSQGTIGGAINLTVESKAETQNGTACTMLIDSLYGGGNRAGSKPGNISIVCTGTNGYIDNVFGGANAADISGSITLNINGGNIGNVFGGNNSTGNITGTIAVTVGDDPNDCGIFQIKNVYGGGNLAPYNHSTNHPTVSIQSGKITEGVYGGGFGSSAVITGNPQVTVTGGTIGAVYGGGNAAAVTGNTVVSISNATVTGSVYGGGNAASISGTTSVSVSSGTIGTGIYGGCNEQGNVGSTATVNVSGGTIGTAQTPANIHGGGFGNATRVLGSVSVTLANTTVNGDVYGGSAEGKTNGNTSRTSGAETTVTMNSGTVTGSIYGGGLGTSQYAADVWGPVKLTINKGSTVGTNVYGGNNANGSPQVSIDVIVNGPTADEASTTPLNLNNVYGGGNEADVASGCTAPHVNIKGCGTVVNRAFGGGNAASVPGTNMEIHGGTFQKVFGGGNGERGVDYGADVNGNVVLNIYAGTITSVFGGSNENGSISGTMNVSIDAENGNTCDTKIVEIYGGGNMAAGKAGTITINNCDAVIDTLYGGAKAASVSNNIALNIVKGQIGSAFGGNNKSGTISGTITVNVNLDECASLGYVYGAGNQAPYTGNPTVNVNYGTVNSVYGGGKGAGAVVTGNPSVTIGDNNSQHVANVTGNVYGGGDAAAVTGNTTVTYNDNNASSTVGNLFGGGNAAGVSGTSTVTLTSGKVLTGIYGGCNSSGTVGGAIALNINGGQVGTSANSKAYGIFGGGKGSATRTGDTVTVTIGTATNAQTYPTIYGDVYGGSAEGQVNDALAEITKVWLKKGVINGDLYGGGFGDNNAEAIVNGSVQVVVDGGTVSGKVFGCNNANGTPKGTVTVTINGTDQPQSGYALSEVYGGGNMANYNPTNINPATVVVNGCNNSIGVVYGGGNAADVLGTDVTIWGGTINQVFGGGHGNKDALPTPTEANVVKRGNEGGDVAVKIYGGTITEVFGGSNSKGTIEGTSSVTIQENGGSCEFDIKDVYGGGNQAAGNAGTLTIGCGAIITGNVYGGAKAADVNNSIHLVITGGTLNNVFGGNNEGGSIAGTITVDINQDNNCDSWQVNNVYGGGNLAPYTASQAKLDSLVVNVINGTISGNVFGGGLGSSAVVTANPHVNVTGGTILGNLYGGGDAASVDGSTYINVLGGTIGASNKHSNIHGGGYGKNTNVSGNVTVNIGNSTSGNAMIYGDVYGGSALGKVNTDHSNGGKYDKTMVNLYSGTIDGNVYGGGLGNDTIEALVYGDVDVFQYGAILIARYSDENLPSSGMIFGCNNVNGTPKGHVRVIVLGTTGTDGQQATSDSIKRASHIESDHTYEMSAVFGGGNHAAYIPDDLTNGSTEVFINGCDDVSIHSVYGGGNAASTPATLVTIQGAYEIEYVFGGGNGAGAGNPGANVGYYAYDAHDPDIAGPDSVAKAARLATYAYGSGKAQTQIYGGRIHKVFGGSNTLGNVREATVAMLDETSDCKLTLDGIYGGGKSAYMEGNAEIELGCIHGLDEIYGGAEQADVGSDIVLTLTSGHYNKVYGGNNLGGKIMGSITVNIEQTGCLPIEIGELYLGGNNAPYSVYGYNADGSIIESATRNIYNHPVLNLKSFASIDTVFGGGKGRKATLAGNPTINANVATGWVDGQYRGTGDRDPNNKYHGKPQTLSSDGVIGQIFGGGNAAKVIGSTTINIGTQDSVSMESLEFLRNKLIAKNGLDTLGNIVRVELLDQNSKIKYTGIGGGNTTITRTVKQKVNGATIGGNVYGGGNEADVTGGTNIVVGREGTPQPVPNPAPAPAVIQPQQQPAPQQTQPAAPQSNAATESQQTRTATPTRL